MFFATVKLVLALAAFNGGTVESFSLKDLTRIVNGEAATIKEIPYQVSLQLKSSNYHFCGGCVLNSNYIITAAHCVTGKSAAALKIVAGTEDLDQGGVERNVSQIIAHKGYDPSDSYRNDIALLKVDNPLQMTALVQSVVLPDATLELYGGEPAVVSGWGRLTQGGLTTKILQRVEIQVSDQLVCAEVYSSSFSMKVDNTQVCADVPEGNKGSCNGDSGGPLTVNGSLVGLVSWANGCATKGFPTVYTRVVSYLDWIEENAV